MEKIENWVLQVTRGFGLLLMVFVLAIATILGTSQLASGFKALLEKQYPEVQFVKSDFVKSAAPEPSEGKQEKREDRIAQKVADAFAPIYENDLTEYLAKNEATLFPQINTRNEQRVPYVANKKKAFAAETHRYVKSWLVDDFTQKYWSDFAEKAIAYLQAAATAQVRPFLVDGAIVESPKQSNVFMNFARKYAAEYKSIRKKEHTDISEQVARALSYAGLFFLILAALIGGMMLAVIRLENKFQRG